MSPRAASTQGVVGLVRRLNDAGAPITGTVRRLAEPAQVDPELLQQLKGAGVLPGATGDYRYSEGYVLVEMHGSDEGLELPVEVASHIFLVDDRVLRSSRKVRSRMPAAPAYPTCTEFCQPLQRDRFVMFG